jgi:hypothetical protein
MAWDEAKVWMSGSLNQKLYEGLLEHAAEQPARMAGRKKILHPDDMPWEMSRQGLLKHLLNEQMNTRMEAMSSTFRRARFISTSTAIRGGLRG